MLCISRKVGESFEVKFGDAVARIVIKPGRGNAVRVGIEAPKEVLIRRSELAERQTGVPS